MNGFDLGDPKAECIENQREGEEERNDTYVPSRSAPGVARSTPGAGGSH